MPPKRVREDLQRQLQDEETDDDETQDFSSTPPVSENRVDTKSRHNEQLKKLFQEHGKLPLTFHLCDGRPTGKSATLFTTELGLQLDKWKNTTTEQKKPIFDRLFNFFHLDLSTGPDSVRDVIDKWMGDLFRNNRSQMHRYYKTLSHLPFEERQKMLPRKFYGDEADWKHLYKLFESDKFKELSKKMQKTGRS